MYTPIPSPYGGDLETLKEWVAQNFLNIAREISPVKELYFNPTTPERFNSDNSRITDGIVVYFVGASAPNEQEGLYQYVTAEGGWTLLNNKNTAYLFSQLMPLIAVNLESNGLPRLRFQKQTVPPPLSWQIEGMVIYAASGVMAPPAKEGLYIYKTTGWEYVG
jgi:hypothetical protein